MYVTLHTFRIFFNGEWVHSFLIGGGGVVAAGHAHMLDFAC